MLRHFLAPTPRFGLENKRLSIGHQQRSPYYWWWQFLRRNAEYLVCCEQGGKGRLSGLYDDFGDVRNEDFHKWWTEGGRGVSLFAEEPLAVKFAEMNTPADWSKSWSSESVMVLAVPLSMSKRQLKGAFAKILEKRHKGHKSGRPSLARLQETSTARYKLEHNYTISGLMTTLAVYDLWSKNQCKPKAERLTLWEIGKECNINKLAIKDALSLTSGDRLIGRNVLGATVSRYIKQAKTIIENTGYGKFPVVK